MGMRTRHDGDCTIYASLINDRPEVGICTCGYGWQYVWQFDGDFKHMYSEELQNKLKDEKDISKKVYSFVNYF